MGALTIPMALLMLAGGLAGLTLERALLPAALLCLAGGTAGLWFLYCALELVVRRSHAPRGDRSPAGARLFAALYGGASAPAIVGHQIAIVHALELAAPMHTLVVLALTTAPATVLALRADRRRRTLWSIRAYATHLSIWTMLAAAWIDLGSTATVGVMLLCHALPTIVGYLEARADPTVLRSVQM